jgi:hypothetical protein
MYADRRLAAMNRGGPMHPCAALLAQLSRRECRRWGARIGDALLGFLGSNFGYQVPPIVAQIQPKTPYDTESFYRPLTYCRGYIGGCLMSLNGSE